MAPQKISVTAPDDALDISPAGRWPRQLGAGRVASFAAGFAQQHGNAGIAIAINRVDAAIRGHGFREALAQ
jgi:hypothetical protein